MPLSWLAHLPGDAARLASKIIDYGHKGQGCFASDTTLAADLGLHRVTVNGYMRLLEALEDGHAMTTEVTGRTTRTRRLRALRRDERGIPTERYVCVSNFARNNLTGNRFKVYAYASFCADTKTEFRNAQAGEKCGITGKDTVRLILRSLETEGWLTRTQDGGGEHGARYDVHPAPLPDPATPPAPETATGPHPDPAAQNTTLGTHPSEQARQVSCGSARRATPVVARGPVENPAAGTLGQAVAQAGAASPEPHKDSPTTISATAYRVLRLLPLEFTPGQYVLAAKAIERAVAEAGDIERIVNRVHRHLADERQEVREPYGWLITRGLRNDPCPAPACEAGQLWPTGETCRICVERWADRRGTPLIFRNSKPVFEVAWTCVDCERPGRGERPADDVCSRCHAEAGIAFASLFAQLDEVESEAHGEWNARRAAEVRAGIRRLA